MPRGTVSFLNGLPGPVRPLAAHRTSRNVNRRAIKTAAVIREDPEFGQRQSGTTKSVRRCRGVHSEPPQTERTASEEPVQEFSLASPRRARFDKHELHSEFVAPLGDVVS